MASFEKRLTSHSRDVTPKKFKPTTSQFF